MRGGRVGRWGSLAATLLLASCASVWFHPEKPLERPRFPPGIRCRDVVLERADGPRLHGWVVWGDSSRRGTVVFFHGNAGNIGSHVPAVFWVVRRGFRAVLFDYRGYGDSEGEPTLRGVHDDGRAVLEWVFTRGLEEGLVSEPVWVWGQSLGGSVAVYAVAGSRWRDRVRFVLVDSAFFSYSLVARDHLRSCCLTWPLLPAAESWGTEDLSPGRWIPRLAPIPTLIIHGTRDAVVPVEHAHLLFQAAAEPKGLWIVRGAGHGRAIQDPDLRRQFLRTLRERLFPP